MFVMGRRQRCLRAFAKSTGWMEQASLLLLLSCVAGRNLTVTQFFMSRGLGGRRGEDGRTHLRYVERVCVCVCVGGGGGDGGGGGGGVLKGHSTIHASLFLSALRAEE